MYMPTLDGVTIHGWLLKSPDAAKVCLAHVCSLLLIAPSIRTSLSRRGTPREEHALRSLWTKQLELLSCGYGTELRYDSIVKRTVRI